MSSASLRFRTIRARSTRLTWPLSSLTTMTTASVCSAIPRAARWRVPSRPDWTVVSASGRTAPAATICSPRMITAPSWSAVLGAKIVSRRSADRSAWIITPDSAISSRPVSRAMSVPWPRRQDGGRPATDGDVLADRAHPPARRAPASRPPIRRAPGLLKTTIANTPTIAVRGSGGGWLKTGLRNTPGTLTDDSGPPASCG